MEHQAQRHQKPDPRRENWLFGVVNLLGPRSTNQRGGQWKTEFTHVELKFELLGRWTRTPITLDRTFMTFYDFDTG